MEAEYEMLRKKRLQMARGQADATAQYQPAQRPQPQQSPDDYYKAYDKAQQPMPNQDRSRLPRIAPDRSYQVYQQSQQGLPPQRPMDVAPQPESKIFPSQANTARMQPPAVTPRPYGQEPEEDRLRRLLAAAQG